MKLQVSHQLVLMMKFNIIKGEKVLFTIRTANESKIGSREITLRKKIQQIQGLRVRKSANCNCAGSSVIIWEGYETSDQVHMKGQCSEHAALNATQGDRAAKAFVWVIPTAEINC